LPCFKSHCKSVLQHPKFVLWTKSSVVNWLALAINIINELFDVQQSVVSECRYIGVCVFHYNLWPFTFRATQASYFECVEVVTSSHRVASVEIWFNWTHILLWLWKKWQWLSMCICIIIKYIIVKMFGYLGITNTEQQRLSGNILNCGAHCDNLYCAVSTCQTLSTDILRNKRLWHCKPCNKKESLEIIYI
jgi:hypothetical protein